MTQPALVVDQVFTTIATGLAPKQVTDYALGMTFANAAARPVRAAATPDEATGAFQQKWLGILGQCGWIVQQAGTSSLSSSASGQTVSIANRLRQTASLLAVDTAVDALQSLVDEDSSALLDMWWNAAAQTGYLQAAVGALSETDDGQQLQLATFTVETAGLMVPEKGFFHHAGKPFEPTGPDAIFTQLVPSSLDMNVATITAVLNQSVFDGKRAEITKLLGDKFADHYRAAPQSLL